MHNDDYQKLRGEVEDAIVRGNAKLALIGLTPITVRLLAHLSQSGAISAVRGVFVDDALASQAPQLAVPVNGFSLLSEGPLDVLVVMDDERKEDLLRAALPYLKGLSPRIILGGYAHFEFRDEVLRRLSAQLLVPSLANGYPNALTHLYQCLVNASRLGLEGVVAEFGMFKGGTTMLLARIIDDLHQDWRIIGFDTFGGFPPRRSPLDMYAHPDCVFRDLDHVRSYLADHRVELVVGDIVSTARRLESENVVLTFMDTDNFTSANAALDVVQERTVIGGAIVFDHFTGTNRFLYTLGERMAASRLLQDSRYFNLHGTGVFYRQG
jgi:O-methyltransferase